VGDPKKCFRHCVAPLGKNSHLHLHLTAQDWIAATDRGAVVHCICALYLLHILDDLCILTMLHTEHALFPAASPLSLPFVPPPSHSFLLLIFDCHYHIAF